MKNLRLHMTVSKDGFEPLIPPRWLLKIWELDESCFKIVNVYHFNSQLLLFGGTTTINQPGFINPRLTSTEGEKKSDDSSRREERIKLVKQ